MSRRRVIVVAVAAGLVVAGGVAASRPGEQAPSRPAATTPVRPAQPVHLVAGEAVPPRAQGPAAISGTAAIAVRESDPAGGPDWAVRTFQRRAQSGNRRVWCSQLGRVVDGQFVWVQPGATTAKRLPLAVTETTNCATSAPISDRLGVQIGGMPDRPRRDPQARIQSTVVWGVVNRAVASATLEHGSLHGSVELHGHAFLRVVRGPTAPSQVRLIVRDFGGGTRRAVPPGSFAVAFAPSSSPSSGRALPPKDTPVAPGPRFVLAARADPMEDGTQLGIFARKEAGGRTCVSGPTAAVGDRAVQSFGPWSGLVIQVPLQCTPLPESADFRPVVLGAGWASGHETGLAGAAVDRARTRRRNRERLADEVGSVTVGVPSGTRLLEVTSPVGVKTVRVTEGRVTVVSWRGQPEVRRALFPQLRRVRGRLVPAGPVVTFEALDERGKSIGEIGSTDANAAWEARKLRAKVKQAEREARERARRTSP